MLSKPTNMILILFHVFLLLVGHARAAGGPSETEVASPLEEEPYMVINRNIDAVLKRVEGELGGAQRIASKYDNDDDPEAAAKASTAAARAGSQALPEYIRDYERFNQIIESVDFKMKEEHPLEMKDRERQEAVLSVIGVAEPRGQAVEELRAVKFALAQLLDDAHDKWEHQREN